MASFTLDLETLHAILLPSPRPTRLPAQLSPEEAERFLGVLYRTPWTCLAIFMAQRQVQFLVLSTSTFKR